MAPQKAHVAPGKKEDVKKMLELFRKYPIVSVINLQNLPSSQYQQMRRQLRGKVEIFMTKRRIMNIALEQLKNDVKGIENLKPYLKGIPALLFTKENPFLLYKIIKKSKSPSAAKPGQLSPKDILVPAGPTPFAPGPVIGELSQLGIKAGVQEGKIVIKEDKVVIKEGEAFSAALASMITRLGILPMEIGLNLVCTFEKGVIYQKNILDIDEKVFAQRLTSAIQHATNLAVEASYVSKGTIKLLLQNAFRNAKGLAVSQGILAKGVVGDVLAKAHREMSALKELVK
ncbi:MAG: 50S ribosomal protein L10 [Nanoarchaeota archaeon]